MPNRTIVIVGAVCPILILTLAGVTLAQSSPSAIHSGQLGFLPNGPKRIILADPAPTPLPWTLSDTYGHRVASGTATMFGPDAQSGDRIQQVDLGQVAPDRYRFSADGVSVPVMIAPDIFAPIEYASLNYFYQSRAGIPIEARYTGGMQWARAAGHPHEVATCFSGKDQRGNDWPGCDYSLNVTGGWYDAGDQGKYVVNGGIALWTLQNLYEEGFGGAFVDGRAKLPEAGNGINDLLDETRWEMRFLLAMQVPKRKRIKVPIGPQRPNTTLSFTEIDAGGMAHHKVADREWTPLPTAPADDPQPRLLYPPSTAATLNLAATAAQCARIWRTIDPTFARTCLTAAERAYAAALRNPQVYAPNSFTGSGGYGDAHLDDEFFWATAELYAATGRPAFAEALHRMPAFTAPLSAPSWGNVAALGTITLATLPNHLPKVEQARQRALLIAAADRYLDEEAHSGYHIPFAGTAFAWGSNSELLNRAIILGIAARLTGKRAYRDAMVDVADYLLGRNPLDQSFISGFGTHPLMNPHHRFWAHKLDPRYPGPPPGVLSGGPNSTAMGDPVASTMKGKCVGMRCWRDENYAFTMNEVAINWNAPLVWVSAYLEAVR